MEGVLPVALFCEDIREEKQGTDTLIGIMPDNLQVPAFPGALQRLCVYFRINFKPELDLPAIKLFLNPIGVERFELGALDTGLVQKSKIEAKLNGAEYAGIISKIRIDNLLVPSPGRISIVLAVGDTEKVLSSINVRLADAQEQPAL